MNQDVKCRVLLLDDNDDIREVLTEILTVRGYEVFSYSDPTICPLQLTPDCRCSESQRCADIIISDIDMPKMNGLEFIENQHAKNCKLRHIALMSGDWSDDRLEQARQLGCNTFSKPLSLQEFHEWLDEVESSIRPSRTLCDWFQESGSSHE